MSKEMFAEHINKALHSAQFAAKDLRDASKHASQMEFIVLERALQMAVELELYLGRIEFALRNPE